MPCLRLVENPQVNITLSLVNTELSFELSFKEKKKDRSVYCGKDVCKLGLSFSCFQGYDKLPWIATPPPTHTHTHTHTHARIDTHAYMHAEAIIHAKFVDLEI